MGQFNGFYRYNLGDIIEFKSVDPPKFVFINRENTVNIMDEKLTLDQAIKAIKETDNELSLKVKDFSIVADKKSNKYIIIIEFNEKYEEPFYLKFIKLIDRYLGKVNETYGYFRHNVKMMKPPELRVCKKDAFDEVENERVISGQPRHQLKILQISDDLNILKEFEDKIIQNITFDDK